MIISLISIILWLMVGGFDWIFDSIECFFVQTEYVFKDDVFIWEPNYNSYHEWVESMLLQDPTYDIDIDLTRQEYIEGKYPNMNEIVDYEVINYIQAELFGYEDTYN